MCRPESALADGNVMAKPLNVLESEAMYFIRELIRL